MGHQRLQWHILEGQWWKPKGVVTFIDTEKDLGRAPVACKWAVPFHCCTVPLDCLLMLSTWGSKDLKSLNSNQREIKNPPKGSSVPIALGSVSAALGLVSVHIPRGMTLVTSACLGRQSNVHNAQSWINLVSGDLFISKGACNQSIFNVTRNTLFFCCNLFFSLNEPSSKPWEYSVLTPQQGHGS